MKYMTVFARLLAVQNILLIENLLGMCFLGKGQSTLAEKNFSLLQNVVNILILRKIILLHLLIISFFKDGTTAQQSFRTSLP